MELSKGEIGKYWEEKMPKYKIPLIVELEEIFPATQLVKSFIRNC